MERGSFSAPPEAESYGFEPKVDEAEIKHLEKEAYRAWEEFSHEKPEELTIEKTVKWLTAGEIYTRKEAVKEQQVSPSEEPYWESRWKKFKDALDGATGKGEPSKTIELLKAESVTFQRAADRKKAEFEGKGLFIESKRSAGTAFEQIASESDEIAQWKKSAENLRTAARLFENQPKWEVAQ